MELENSSMFCCCSALKKWSLMKMEGRTLQGKETLLKSQALLALFVRERLCWNNIIWFYIWSHILKKAQISSKVHFLRTSTQHFLLQLLLVWISHKWVQPLSDMPVVDLGFCQVAVAKLPTHVSSTCFLLRIISKTIEKWPHLWKEAIFLHYKSQGCEPLVPKRKSSQKQPKGSGTRYWVGGWVGTS